MDSQSLLFISPTAVIGSNRSTFTNSHLNSKYSTPLSISIAKQSPRHSPCMLLGIPRLFGRSGRPKQSETVETIQVAPPPPPPIQNDGPLTWVKAHPFQAFATMSVLFFVVRRTLGLDKKKKNQSTNFSNMTTTMNPSKSSKNSTTLRAIPKRHESTEEALDLLANTARKYIIVGGKGGVGKTSMSAAVATSFADRGQMTLIISTDPAHSLSDAFGQSVSGGDPVPVMGIDNLYAQEIDPDRMKQTFKMMSGMDGMKGMGMDDMGLDDLNSLFDTIPPGFDEAVALVEIIKYIQADSEYTRFERIIFDTAPTGHTLRLLALPDFLNGFFGKVISMKSKFGSVMNQFKGMFGGQDMDMDASAADMEELKRSMSMVRDLFRDEYQTEFIVATIPNMMAIAESKRLVEELTREQIPVRHLFVNQVQPSNDGCTFCSARHKEQTSNMKYVQNEFSGLQISTIQSFDKEIKGSAALRAMGAQLFPDHNNENEKKSTIENKVIKEGPNENTTPKAKAEVVE